jgi:transposase
MPADAYAGFTKLYEPNRKGGPIIEAACWAHWRRKLFDLARLSRHQSRRIDVLFAIEREIKVLRHTSLCACARERSRPLIVELRIWLREQRDKLS